MILQVAHHIEQDLWKFWRSATSVSFAGEFLLPPLNISYKQAQDPRRLNPELALGTRLQPLGGMVLGFVYRMNPGRGTGF